MWVYGVASQLVLRHDVESLDDSRLPCIGPNNLQVVLGIGNPKRYFLEAKISDYILNLPCLRPPPN